MDQGQAQPLELVDRADKYGINKVLKFRVSPEYRIDYKQVCVRRCIDHTPIVHCGVPDEVKTPNHDKGEPFELSKKKNDSFSLKILCTGRHFHKMVPQELYVFCRAVNGIEFKSDPFVFTGNRERTRKVPKVPKSKTPASPVVVTPIQPSISNSQPSQFQEKALPYQNENPPQPSIIPDSPYDPNAYGVYKDFQPMDFSSRRFAN